MFKNPQDLKGLTVNLVLGLLKQSLWIALTFYGINFKITNLDLF